MILINRVMGVVEIIDIGHGRVSDTTALAIGCLLRSMRSSGFFLHLKVIGC